MKRRKIVLDNHHRRSRHQNGTNDPENLFAFHTLFWDGEPHRVAKILNDTYIDPNFKLVVVKRNSEEDFQGTGCA